MRPARRRGRSDGRLGNSDRIAKLHPAPCSAWGSQARIAAGTWESPILAQLGSLDVEGPVRAQILAARSSGWTG
jgi:hypothetical protein